MTDSELIEFERRFWFGDADYYRDLLTAECRMALPGMGLVDRQAAIDGIAAGPRWGDWKLAFHQQSAAYGICSRTITEVSSAPSYNR